MQVKNVCVAMIAVCSILVANSWIQNRFIFKIKIIQSFAMQLGERDAISSKNKSIKRAHQNKYSNYSKKDDFDPLELAILYADKQECEKKSQHTSLRGTTVPKTSATTNMSRDNNQTARFHNISSINPSDPFTFGYVRVGTIIGAHGVRGEVKAQFEYDFIDERLRTNSVLYIKKPSRLTPRPVYVQSGRRQVNDIYLLSFQNVESRTVASFFRGYSIFIKSSERPVLQADEYLIRDLVGLRCYLLQKPDLKMATKLDLKEREMKKSEHSLFKELVAEVVGVVPPDELCNPALAALMHSMLEIQLISGPQKGDLCLVPFVPSIVKDINLDEGRLVLDPPLGLLEATYKKIEKEVVIRGFLPEQAATYLSDNDRYVLELQSYVREESDSGSVPKANR